MDNEQLQAVLIEEGRKLRTAIADIAYPSPTSVRNTLEVFAHHVAPSRARESDSEFPYPCRRHALNTERCNFFTTRYGLVLFHIGNAILAYYDVVNHGNNTGAVIVLEARVALLREIASRQVEQFEIGGSDRSGYYLMNAKMRQTLAQDFPEFYFQLTGERVNVFNEKEPITPVQTDRGGTDGAGSTEELLGSAGDSEEN